MDPAIEDAATRVIRARYPDARSGILHVVDDLRLDLIERCANIAGAALGEGAFAPGAAIWVGTREVAHFDGVDELDVRLTRGVIRERRHELGNDERVELRPATSDWIRVRVTTRSELDYAVALVRDAVVANLPSASPGSPPTGRELERRRRFH
jgi:hypothetical protein